MYSYGPPPMAGQKQDNQHKHTFSSYVRIWNMALKTCQRRWTIGKSGERGSGISVLVARHDDDDDDIRIEVRYIVEVSVFFGWIFIEVFIHNVSQCFVVGVFYEISAFAEMVEILYRNSQEKVLCISDSLSEKKVIGLHWKFISCSMTTLTTVSNVSEVSRISLLGCCQCMTTAWSLRALI